MRGVNLRTGLVEEVPAAARARVCGSSDRAQLRVVSERPATGTECHVAVALPTELIERIPWGRAYLVGTEGSITWGQALERMQRILPRAPPSGRGGGGRRRRASFTTSVLSAASESGDEDEPPAPPRATVTHQDDHEPATHPVDDETNHDDDDDDDDDGDDDDDDEDNDDEDNDDEDYVD